MPSPSLSSPSTTYNAAATTASSSLGTASSLPQELVDLIIDQVALDGDLATLQTCALTAASWLPRCRSHLFSAVYLHPNNYTHMEERFRPNPNAAPLILLPAADNSNNPSPAASTRTAPPSPPNRNSPPSPLAIAQYVRHVFLQAGTRDEDEQPVPRDAELSVGLLRLFPHAEEFDLVNVRWGGLRHDVQTYFTAAHSQASMISALTLREMAFPILADLVGLVKGLKALKILRLRNVSWESAGQEEGGTAANRAPGGVRPSSSSANPSGASSDAQEGGIVVVGAPLSGPQLEELEMYECTSPGAFVAQLFERPTATAPRSITAERLQRLALDWTGREEDPAILRNLIFDAGAALQILEVDLAWQRPAVPLDLRLNTSLRELYLDGLLLDDSEDSPTNPNPSHQTTTAPRCWVPTVTGGISSWFMHKFVCYLILSYLTSLQRLDLEHIDEVLSQPQFDSLECVAFSITILPISGVVPPRREAIWEAIRRRMVGVETRGVLRQMRDGVIMG